MMSSSSQLTRGSSNRRAASLGANRLLSNWTSAMVSSLSRYAVASVVAAGFTAFSVHAQSQADQPRPTFRSAVDLVSIQASVRDKHGRPMPGLKASDFEVRDNGQPRSILSLRSDLRSPVSVAVLVDMSGSMRVGTKIAISRGRRTTQSSPSFVTARTNSVSSPSTRGCTSGSRLRQISGG